MSEIAPDSIDISLRCSYGGWVEGPCIMNCTVKASLVVILEYSASFMCVRIDMCFVIIHRLLWCATSLYCQLLAGAVRVL